MITNGTTAGKTPTVTPLMRVKTPIASLPLQFPILTTLHIGLCLLTRNLRLLGAGTKLTTTRFEHYLQWIELDVY